MAELLLRRWIHLWELRCEHSIEEVLEGCWPSLLRVLSLSNRTTQCFTWDGCFKNEESGCWKVRVICDCLRCSWLWDVCGSIGDFLSLCTVGTRWKLELSCHNTQGPGTLGPVCQPLGSVLVSYILPLLPLVRWCSWSVNPLETWPLLCNLVKTARQHCHLSEEKRMQVCFAKSYIHVKGTLASSCGGQWGGCSFVSQRIWWGTGWDCKDRFINQSLPSEMQPRGKTIAPNSCLHGLVWFRGLPGRLWSFWECQLLPLSPLPP